MFESYEPIARKNNGSKVCRYVRIRSNEKFTVRPRQLDDPRGDTRLSGNQCRRSQRFTGVIRIINEQLRLTSLRRAPRAERRLSGKARCRGKAALGRLWE
jgi:hypothetical protein